MTLVNNKVSIKIRKKKIDTKKTFDRIVKMKNTIIIIILLFIPKKPI